MRLKKIIKEQKGYFTVEASLVLPIIILFTTMLIFLAFYSYDKCILEQSAFEAAVRGSHNRFKSNEQACQEAKSAADYLIQDKLFAVKNLSYEVSVNALAVTVSYKCEVDMPFISWLEEYLDNVDFTIYVKKSVLRSRAVQIKKLGML